MFTKLSVGIENIYGKMHVLLQFYTEISLSEKRINILV